MIRLNIEALLLLGGGIRGVGHIFHDIISVENLLISWQEFLRGKRRRRDVAEFTMHGMDGILHLHHDLIDGTYRHGPYQAFKVNDPKPRDIHKASVRDRLLHHAVVRILYPYFDRKFIHDSYSSRTGRGTHRAMNRFHAFGYRVSRNHTRTAWVLKCDIRKFFASIDHGTLLDILRSHIADPDVLWLFSEIIGSFHSTNLGVGLPLGNLTSQLLVNIYMNEFDQFVRRGLRVKHYLRYADDFAVFSHDRDWLMELLPRIGDFLQERLKLDLHPYKVSISTLASGIDFLGWIHFTDHRVLRTTTERRMFQRLAERAGEDSRQSYLGLLGHGNTYKIIQEINRFTE